MLKGGVNDIMHGTSPQAININSEWEILYFQLSAVG